MSINKELQKRIDELEVEQERQLEEVSDLQRFVDVPDLDERLKGDISAPAPQKQKPKVSDIMADISALDEKLKGDITPAPLPTKSKPAETSFSDIDDLLAGLEDQPKVTTKGGYVIRLDFGRGAPVSEWSDETKGWRTKGLGSRYATQVLAQRKFAELKKKWPDYPFSITNAS